MIFAVKGSPITRASGIYLYLGTIDQGHHRAQVIKAKIKYHRILGMARMSGEPSEDQISQAARQIVDSLLTLKSLSLLQIILDFTDDEDKEKLASLTSRVEVLEKRLEAVIRELLQLEHRVNILEDELQGLEDDIAKK